MAIAKLQQWVLEIAVGVLLVYFPFTSLMSYSCQSNLILTLAPPYPPLTPCRVGNIVHLCHIYNPIVNMHSQIQFNLTKDLSHTPFAFTCNHHQLVMTDRSPRMAFHTLCRDASSKRGYQQVFLLGFSRISVFNVSSALPCINFLPCSLAS